MGDIIDYPDLITKAKKILPKDFEGDKLLWDMLRDIRLLKYVRRSQLKNINPLYSKICAKQKINTLIELKLIRYTYEDVLVSSNASLKLLWYLKYNTNILPKGGEGNGDINELNNTEVFIQALRLPDYKALLYPNFDYVIPDALLIRAKDNAYKLEFLEIEASKSNWNDWLENKKINYLKLANDPQVYFYWKEQCTYLGLSVPDIKDFKFSVSIIGKINQDFNIGFNFKESLYER